MFQRALTQFPPDRPLDFVFTGALELDRFGVPNNPHVLNFMCARWLRTLEQVSALGLDESGYGSWV